MRRKVSWLGFVLATLGAAGAYGDRGGDRAAHPEAFRAAGALTEGDVTLSAEWLEKALFGAIADRGSSKRWDDLLSLDGGTVGIAHFAGGGLRHLHAHMDARRFLGRDAAAIPARPYGDAAWREGMRRFLSSPDAPAVQVRAWIALVEHELREAVSHGWRSERALAIAAGIANSGGFARLAQRNGWDAERTLAAYAAGSAHRARRRARIDREFPSGGATTTTATTPSPTPAEGPRPSGAATAAPAPFIRTTYLGRFPRSCQYGRTRTRADIRGAVLHEGGSPERLVASTRWQEGCISTHFVIRRDGTVYQMMDLEREGHHAPPANRGSVGIDLETTSRRNPSSVCSQSRSSDPQDCTYGDALLASLRQLLDWLATQTGIRVDARQVVGHFEVGGHVDPRLFPWQRIGIDGSGKRVRGWSNW